MIQELCGVSLTARNVPGRKIIPKSEICFI